MFFSEQHKFLMIGLLDHYKTSDVVSCIEARQIAFLIQVQERLVFGGCTICRCRLEYEGVVSEKMRFSYRTNDMIGKPYCGVCFSGQFCDNHRDPP